MKPIDIVYIATGILLLGFIPAFIFWYHFFVKDPQRKRGISRWSGFRKKSLTKFQLETANNLLSQGSYGTAENEYRSLLKSLPDEIEVHLGLAECLFDQSIKGLKKYPEKKEEALVHYKWALDFYNRKGEPDAAMGLYKRLLGPYSESELGITLKE